jgi:uncharacterized protein YndB with AHSA1/START domain
MEYQESTSISAPAEQVFRFVCDPQNMPQYLPTVHRASMQGPSRVEMEGESAGKPYRSDGELNVNYGEKRMTWGSDGENRYAGWLQVTGDGPDCNVTVHLAFEPRPDQEQAFRDQMGGRDEAIRRGLRDALVSIKNICEGEGGKVPNPAETGTRGYVS